MVVAVLVYLLHWLSCSIAWPTNLRGCRQLVDGDGLQRAVAASTVTEALAQLRTEVAHAGGARGPEEDTGDTVPPGGAPGSAIGTGALGVHRGTRGTETGREEARDADMPDTEDETPVLQSSVATANAEAERQEEVGLADQPAHRQDGTDEGGTSVGKSSASGKADYTAELDRLTEKGKAQALVAASSHTPSSAPGESP